jgi:hypothetical protein
MKNPFASPLPITTLVALAWLTDPSFSRAAKIGINFQDDWNDGGGAPVTDTSFDISPANWFNMPRVVNSIATPFSTSSTINLPGAGPLTVEWSAVNTYSLTGETPATPGDPPGADQVVYGYLDDTGTGYRVRISGFRNSVSSYKVSLIASTDGGTGFTDANVAHSSATDILTYGLPNPGDVVSALGGGIYAISPETPAIDAATANNTINISGVTRSGSLRSTLAGIIIDYTPSTTNVPVIEVQPTAPASTIFTGQSFTLSVSATGSNLTYQWRKGGTNLTGETNPTLTKTNTTTGDSGNYDVVVSGVGAPATSLPVTIAISALVQPVFTTTPVAQTFYAGYPATFTAAATGGELTYTWKKGATTVGTGETLTLPAITAADAGTYTVTAANAVGNVSTSAVLTVNAPVPGTYEAVQASQKPLLWYRYSETTIPAVNTSSVANSGSTGAAGIGTAKRYLAFQEPGALVGDAANKSAGIKTNSQFIDIPYDAGLNTPSFTAELWVKAPPSGKTVRFDPLINRGANASDGFLFFGGNGVTKWQFRTYNGTTRNQIASTVDIEPNVWTHLVGTYDAATDTQRFYVNGAEQGTGISPTAGYTPNSALPLRLGAFPNDNGDVGGGSFAGGGLDEVAIYPAALTAAEVLSHYQNGTNATRPTPYATLVQTSTPAGYWRMDDPAGPIAPALVNSGTSGKAFQGAYGGDLQPALAGPQPPGDPGFEASNLSVGTTANGYNAVPPLGITTNTITVTTWMKRAETFTTSDLGWPAWLGAGGGFHIDGTGGRPYGELRYHWDGGQWGWGSGLQVPADIWTFCALVIEPTRATVYMGDGNSLRKSTVNATHTAHLLNQAHAFGGNQAGNTGRNFIGQLDESAVYDRALSETELFTLFATGTGIPLTLDIASGGIMDDTKPSGTPLQGFNYGTSWIASSQDGTVTRTGVQQFTTIESDQIRIPANPAFDSPTGTVMFWMKAGLPEGTGNSGSMLFDHRTSNGVVVVLDDTGNLFVQVFPQPLNTFTSSFVADDLWHHVAISYNQDAAGTIDVYVDGTLATSNPNGGAWSWPAAQPLELGTSHDPYWRKYGGQLDDFRFYSQSLSAAEIAQIKTSGDVVVPAALQVRYDFATAGSGLTLTWPFGVLESSTTMQASDPWTPVPGATSPFPINPTGPVRFFRTKVP